MRFCMCLQLNLKFCTKIALVALEWPITGVGFFMSPKCSWVIGFEVAELALIRLFGAMHPFHVTIQKQLRSARVIALITGELPFSIQEMQLLMLFQVATIFCSVLTNFALQDFPLLVEKSQMTFHRRSHLEMTVANWTRCVRVTSFHMIVYSVLCVRLKETKLAFMHFAVLSIVQRQM